MATVSLKNVHKSFGDVKVIKNASIDIADQEFVALVGPSGCGKSSLVKAGLLPQLTQNVLPVYVEATASDTENRILSLLRKNLSSLERDLSLADCFQSIRVNNLARDRKILIVIDQFEQWLHAHRVERNTELLRALRQADGVRLQCILMVR